MASSASHTCHKYIVSTGDSNAVILVVDGGILQNKIICRRYIKPISIMASWVAATSRIWCIACGIVEMDIAQKHSVSSGHIKAVNWIVLDIQVGDNCILQIFGDDEVIRPWIFLDHSFEMC